MQNFSQVLDVKSFLSEETTAATLISEVTAGHQKFQTLKNFVNLLRAFGAKDFQTSDRSFKIQYKASLKFSYMGVRRKIRFVQWEKERTPQKQKNIA